ncbi:MAG: HEAT repeat domain-containing protein [Acidobacteria bacterium]|nr:HEAT repeat domain-containing protein [Acidobacteriota bacterium]
MPPTPAADRMSAEQTAVLVEFARACRTAVRSVSLYPATHPSIQGSLSRVTTAAGRLVPAGDVTLTVHPDTLLVDGQVPARADQAIGELADLMHDRLVAALRVERGADALDWHALLLLLARPPEELTTEGGIAKAWAAAGRNHFQIREIDYAEVLRERGGGQAAEWDQIIAFCLQEGTGPLDESSLAALLETLGDTSRFGGLLERLQGAASGGDATVSARAAALIQLIQKMLDATAQWPRAHGEDRVLQTAADAASRMTPEMMLALIEQARTPGSAQAQVASAVVDRMGDETIASFVAGSVVKEGGASERLAQALQLLVPEIDRKERLLDLAKQEVEQSPFGRQSGFEDLWQSAASMLASYSDETYVSAAYARELSGAKARAVDVERVSDDPPERIQGWLGTVDDDALRRLDFDLLLDLLQVEDDAAPWRDIVRIAVSEIERRTKLGEVQDAQKLAFAIVRETGAGGRETLRSAAESAIETLAGGPLARHIVVHLRKVDDADVDPFGRLCRTVGERIIGPLAEVLMVEENSRAIRRLRELLFGFGAAGRETVERLKGSSNPAVRRTAIDMLRMFGGQDALADLATMLEDTDPEVQRDAIRAIAQLGNDEAFAVLQKALMAGTASGSTIPQQLISLREERAVPLLCYVLNHSAPRGRMVEVHAQVIEALGALGAHPESTRTLRAALYRGDWWAPARTAALRRTAALALRRIGSPEARAVLEEAKRKGSRGVRNAVRAQASSASRREQERT